MTLSTNVSNLATRVATEAKSLRTLINGNTADLNALTTQAKTSLVAAINECYAAVETLASAEGGATIDDTTTTATSVWSSSKTSTQISSAVSALVASAPATLDTLKELSTALGDDPSFATTINTALGNRVRVDVATQGLTSTQKTNALTNIGAAPTSHTHALTDASLTGTLPVSKGGTGGTDANTALTNLGAAAKTHTHAAADITSGVFASARLPSATEAVSGSVELATLAEATTGADTTRAVTPAGVRAVTGDPTTDFVAAFEAGLE